VNSTGSIRLRHAEKTLSELIDRRDTLEARISRLEAHKLDLWESLSELTKVNMSIGTLRREIRSGL
jgi:chaperonin cofactor prefoldin